MGALCPYLMSAYAPACRWARGTTVLLWVQCELRKVRFTALCTFASAGASIVY